MKLKKILVTTDFSDLSRQAFTPAAALARKFQAELHLVHVLEAAPPILFSTPMGAQAYSPEKDYLLKYRDLLARTAMDPVFEGLSVKPHVLEGGHVHDRLQQFQKHHAIDLTVVASHGRTGLGHLLLGSFAERVVRLSATPVLTYPARKEDAPAREFAPRKLLVPIDFSDNARAALEAARFFATSFHARIRFQNVVEPLPDLSILALEGVAVEEFNHRRVEAQEEARRRLAELIRKEVPTGVDADFSVEFGHPYEDIAREAKDFGADLIIMATHGRTGIRHVLMGSVAERVVQKSPCPVLTIRPG